MQSLIEALAGLAKGIIVAMAVVCVGSLAIGMLVGVPLNDVLRVLFTAGMEGAK